MGEYEFDSPLASLSLQRFLEMTNRERPRITGGCVLLTGATLTTAMILMALSISHKKATVAADKRGLKRKMQRITEVQRLLFDAAAFDLSVFNEYRAALKSKSKNKAAKLKLKLVKATDSLAAAGDLLVKAIDEININRYSGFRKAIQDKFDQLSYRL